MVCTDPTGQAQPVRDDGVIDAYLERLGLDRESPSVEALNRVHRAQVERVPYETMWIHMDQRWSVDREESLRRIARHSRGGYCFHLNGALSLVLETLGYETSLHVGGVHGPDGPTDGVMDNHLVLIVHGLPSDANPAGDWYVDAGLGDALHEPLPLVENVSSRQGPFTYGLTRSDGIADWQFRHDPSGSFFGMAFRVEPTVISSFVGRNDFLSTSAESTFVKTVMAQRRDSSGVDILRGQVLRRLDVNGPRDTILNSKDEWFETLREVFDLTLDDVSTDDRQQLWSKTSATHAAWQTAHEEGTDGSG